MNKSGINAIPIALIVISSIVSCKKEKPKSLPVVATVAASEITNTSAKAGGNITNTGNSEITERGIVYSRLVEVPTLSDDKKIANSTDNEFEVLLETLNSGTIYKIRAYAKNSVGVGYGEVMEFNTGNAAPLAIDVSVSGTVQVGEELTAIYTYQDAEGDQEGNTSFQWYMAESTNGTNETIINGATASTFTVQAAQFGKYIRVGITPKAATGTTTGAEVKSQFMDAEPTSVSFTYNGNHVTYGIILSPTTNRKWLDRNLGASNVASSPMDFANYGDLFQWGRKDDAHQLVTRSGPNSGEMISVNGTTSLTAPFAYSTTDNPGAKFIIVSGEVDPYDWRKPQNNNLWQGVNGTNNPCPSGWRLATEAEWAAENLTNITDAFSKLKLTLTGAHDGSHYGNGAFFWSESGQYWTSTLANDWFGNINTFSMRIRILSDSYLAAVAPRADGYAVRCIKH